MPIDPEINKKLKEMWRIEEKKDKEQLTLDEERFYKDNLKFMYNYYSDQSTVWLNNLFIHWHNEAIKK